MGEFTKLAEGRLTRMTADPNQAIDPATIMLVITVIKELITLCSGRGSTYETVATSLASPSLWQRMQLRMALRRKMGAKEYRRLGGRAYADKVLAAGRAASMSERVGFVRETALEAHK